MGEIGFVRTMYWVDKFFHQKVPKETLKDPTEGPILFQ